jgi:hypothetical protein
MATTSEPWVLQLPSIKWPRRRRGQAGRLSPITSGLKQQTLLRLKFQVQHPEPAGYRMLRWTDEVSTSAVRNVA